MNFNFEISRFDCNHAKERWVCSPHVLKYHIGSVILRGG